MGACCSPGRGLGALAVWAVLGCLTWHFKQPTHVLELPRDTAIHRAIVDINQPVVVHSDSSFKHSSIAYATFFSSQTFLPALQVFLYSFVNVKHDNSPLLICFPSTLNRELLPLISKETTKYPGLSWAAVSIPPIEGWKNTRSRWTLNWTKLHLWNLVDFQTILYIDLDVLLLRPIHGAFSHKFNNFLGTSDLGKWSSPSTRKINGGVFLLHPNKTTFSNLMSARDEKHKYAWDEAEQGLFNHVFKTKCCLPLQYNTQKSVQHYWPQIWDISRVYVLHFVGEKPWAEWASSQYRRFGITHSVIRKRIDADSWDADESRDLHLLWKNAYFSSRKSEFDQIEVFIGYNKKSSKKLIQAISEPFPIKFVKLGGFLLRNNDLDGFLIAPELQSATFQRQIGTVFSTLLVASISSKAQFIGAACAENKITTLWGSSVFEPGVAIDWTKVDFDFETVFYWQGFYTEDFYKSAEASYPGIIGVFSQLLGDLLPSMARGFYSSGGSRIIATRKIVRVYVKDSMSLMKSFDKIYSKKLDVSIDYCPFFTTTNDKCRAVLLDIYLNIWIAQNSLKTVFAVDENVIESIIERYNTLKVAAEEKQLHDAQSKSWFYWLTKWARLPKSCRQKAVHQ